MKLKIICYVLVAALLSLPLLAQLGQSKSSGYIGETEKNKGSQANTFNGAMADVDKCLKLDVPASFSSGKTASFKILAKNSSSIVSALASPKVQVEMLLDEDYKPLVVTYNGKNSAQFQTSSEDIQAIASFVVPTVRQATMVTLKVTVNGIVRTQQVQIVP